jgi:uncharacterized protein
MRRSFYSEVDPFCQRRPIDDSQYTIDHFYAKLFKTAETLKTKTGRLEGLRRVEVLKKYLIDLKLEI